MGNEVVKNLALFGVGHIFVVDFDRIEKSNLTRSVLFREEDATNHAYKAEVVARRAMEINPQIKVTPIVGNLYSDVGFGIYRSVDVVIGCLDSRFARYLLNRLCLRAGKTWIDGSIENLTGVVKVFVPGVNCYECAMTRAEFGSIMLRTGCADVVRSQEVAGRVATTPVGASILGGMQVQEAMKVIHRGTEGSKQFRTLEGRILRYDGMTNTMSIFKYDLWKKHCTAHERWDEVTPCSTLSAEMTVRQTLNELKALLKSDTVMITMRNNKFIDKIVVDSTEQEYTVMMSESQLERHISQDAELRRLSYRNRFFKSAFEEIDDDFPYQDLTLRQIGIPPFDVLQVTAAGKLHYVELTADKHLYFYHA